MARSGTRRSNEELLQSLQGTGPESDLAQSELRQLIRGALQAATTKFGSLDDATLEDLTQVALLRVLDKLDRFEGRSRFTTWAYSVAVRAAFSELRKSQYRTAGQLSEGDDGREEPADESPGATKPLERTEIVDVLYRIIENELTERQRKAVLAELHETPIGDLEQELGTNRNALYKLMHDARLKLRKGLESAGFTNEGVRGAFDL